jgi:hypothetical protein
MVKPASSRRRKVSWSDHSGTTIAVEMRTRGASSCVGSTATAFPDWTISVSSEPRCSRAETIPARASFERAALPRPP